YLGEYCHHKDPCLSFCLNGGSCVSSGPPSAPSCLCPLGFSGSRCDNRENTLCYPKNPCRNKGTCSLLPHNQYTCQCAPGWT
ncbi:neurogenic locus notch protein 2-like, partial [Clarias magur]